MDVDKESFSDRLWSIGVNFATVFLFIMLFVHAICLFQVGQRMKEIEERLNNLETKIQKRSE